MKTITLVGRNGVGKSFAGKQLAEYFQLTYVETRVLFEQHLGGGLPREAYTAFARDLTQRYGASGIAEWVLQQLNPQGKYVIDRMIDTADISYLREQGSFILLITAEEKERIRHIIGSNRLKD